GRRCTEPRSHAHAPAGAQYRTYDGAGTHARGTKPTKNPGRATRASSSTSTSDRRRPGRERSESNHHSGRESRIESECERKPSRKSERDTASMAGQALVRVPAVPP